ncbi:protein kinase, partial [Achlya hypogyna]
VPDPTGWISPTGYGAAFLEAPSYDAFSPRSSRPFLRSQVQRTLSSKDASTRSLPPPSPHDQVHFAAYAPVCVAPASAFDFCVWAFLVHQRDEMREEAMADGVAKQLSRDVLLPVRRGALVHISLRVPDGFRVVNEPTQALTWEGVVMHAAFAVECLASSADGQVLFEATIVVGAAVMVLRSYLFVAGTMSDVDELPSELEVLHETCNEIAFDDLQIDECVGRGNFGDAYRATYNGQEVVVKTIRPGEFGESQDQIVKEFRHEAAVLSLFGHHPHIVPFVGACTDVTRPLSLVTQYLPHGSLEDQFQKQTLDELNKVRILRDAAAGLLNIHEGGFIHRDIAARNCLVDDEFRAKICDFGLCRRVNSYGGAHFAEGMMPLKYLAPESLTPPHSFSYRSDAYSFGVLMWETFTESKPFPDMTGAAAAAYVLEGYRLEVPVTVPTRYQALIERCLQSDPSKRP